MNGAGDMNGGAVSSRTALLALIALLLAFFAPIVLRGRVIYPHDNRVEMGIGTPDDSGLPKNRQFTDQSSFYVPEIHHHLNGDHAAWLSTWNPHVELGRPSSHVSGFSPVFIVTRVLSWFTRDAFVVYTVLAILAVIGSAIFTFLWFSALGLHPWACFAGAAGLALGVFAIYWLTFAMFLWGLCWTLGIAWLVVRYFERPTFARGFGIAFCVHALLLTAYPQQIVWHGYLLVLFTLLQWWRNPAREVRALLVVAAWAAAGFLLAAPVYLDLLHSSANSARAGVDAEYFLPALPSIQSLKDVASYLSLTIDPFVSGNPIEPTYAPHFNGIALTPFFAALVAIACLEGGWKRAWPWLAFASVCFVLSIWPAAYLFGVAHLGLSFSRFAPLAAATIPLAVAATIALDRTINVGFRRPWLAIAVAGIVPLVSIAYQSSTQTGAGPWIGIAMFAGFAALVRTRKAWLVPVLVVATVGLYTSRLVLARPESTIARTSHLVERLRELTRDGTRYAFVGAKAGIILPPNQEAQNGLRSIHSYDSLASRLYNAWVLRVSEIGARTFGRHFSRISSEARLGAIDVSLGAVSTLVSTAPLQSPAIDSAGEVDGFQLYKTKTAPIRFAQFDEFTAAAAGEVVLGTPGSRSPLNPAPKPVKITEERDDRLVLKASPSDHPTLLFVSRQFHADWQGTLVDGAQRTSVSPVLVNDFYIGVVLPPAAHTVELVFRPWARWMWVSQLFIALGFSIAITCTWLSRRPRSA
jgi:hypothetical protein